MAKKKRTIKKTPLTAVRFPRPFGNDSLATFNASKTFSGARSP